jgi:transposase
MHSNNSHNNYTVPELYKIIETVRQREGKSTLKLVAERIDRSISGTWHLLTDAGMPTRLYSESLGQIEERIRSEGAGLTFSELYERFGGTWASPESFYKFVHLREITFKRPSKPAVAVHTRTGRRKTRQAVLQLLKDVRENGYDLSTLTREEIAEMYEVPYPTICAYVARYKLSCTRAARGPRKQPSAPPALL